MVNYRVLARKYRPVRLNEVIGQNFTVTALTNAFNINKISHAFLFTGIRGVGKTTIARIIAMGLNCKMDDKPVANPCGKCENCIQILEDRYELVLLDYNFLTSPKKLMEYQKQYFDNELVESNIKNLNWIKIKNNKIEIGKITENNE